MENKQVQSSSMMQSIPTTPIMINGNLDQFTGPWTEATAKHLLFRTIYGPNQSQIEDAQELGLTGAIDQLLADPAEVEPPLNYAYQEDPTTPIGASWVLQPNFPNTVNYRRRSVRAWIVGLLLEGGMSIHAKMTLFWHNHFVTAGTNDPKFEYQYYELLRTHALGNFRDFTKAITLNPAMLIFLNGNQNTKNAPNENYARELFELFTVGKGKLAGPGDYSTFTEDDVRAAAQILTGWNVQYDRLSGDLPTAVFRPFRHDQENKQLSYHYDNSVVTDGGDEEYSTLIDIIFDSHLPAYFLARKLYRWFVYYHIDETIEQNVIEPLAQVLIDNDYEIKPALSALMSSEHFYDDNSLGCQIKSPVDFVNGLVNQFSLYKPSELVLKYRLWDAYYRGAVNLQQEILLPPSVAGWKAYYQEPTFNRLWINSATLPLRFAYVDLLTLVGFGDQGSDQRLIIDVFAMIENLPDPLDPNEMIRDLTNFIFPYPIFDSQIDFLKEVLIPGLPDDEWTIEYSAYLNNPNNEEIKNAVEQKLRLMFRTMLSMAEFQLQ